MIDPFLVMKSCRDNGLFETDPKTLDSPNNAFRFFSPHFPVTGTVTVLKDTACVFFDDMEFQQMLETNISLSKESANMTSKGQGWVIKDLPTVHAFWKTVRQTVVSPPRVAPNYPFGEGINN